MKTIYYDKNGFTGDQHLSGWEEATQRPEKGVEKNLAEALAEAPGPTLREAAR